MSAFSDFLENELLDHILRNEAYTAPSTVYVALFTGSTGLESNAPTLEVVDATGYARQSAAFDVAASGATANSGVLTFGAAVDSNWGIVTHIATMDASTNGNVLYYGSLGTSQNINIGDSLRLPIGDLIITHN